ncbi:hypothetical protein [Accumulibacter sp.]|uniref:hypothetical protein n=1 Tax=Accumulibacter sp. TaxID=2053492 RepID=UPI002588E100|nr:hypothetical protein [Accumulibacter sp.]MCM8578329.1 hypothetical protein [Accumulibacter sp.]MCM8621697.1 hypothetical protein [Accumulibacter sp.]
MSRTLERRTARLEAQRSNVNQIAIIIRRIIGREIFRAVIGDDVVDRRGDEAEDAFVGRAKVEALTRTDRRPCRVLLLPQQVLQ